MAVVYYSSVRSDVQSVLQLALMPLQCVMLSWFKQTRHFQALDMKVCE